MKTTQAQITQMITFWTAQPDSKQKSNVLAYWRKVAKRPVNTWVTRITNLRVEDNVIWYSEILPDGTLGIEDYQPTEQLNDHIAFSHLVVVSDADYKVLATKKIKSALKRWEVADLRINELDAYIEYPYKKGHMECVNLATDTWEPTKKHTNMVATQDKYQTNASDLIEGLLKGASIFFDEFVILCDGVGVGWECVTDYYDDYAVSKGHVSNLR